MNDGRGYAGTTQWKNAFRNFVNLKRTPKNDSKGPARILETSKSNYAPDTELQIFLHDGTFSTRSSEDERDKQARERQAVFDAIKINRDKGRAVQQSTATASNILLLPIRLLSRPACGSASSKWRRI